jgi:flavin reductase (DIM6/NTAB) family NADH-FMN oxidoreductase RutF
MTSATEPSRYVPLSVDTAVWDDYYSVAPLVLVGTMEVDGSPDVAPKHLAMPLSRGPLFGFVCRPEHATYRNALATSAFTVGYPSPSMVLAASLAAGPRDADGTKPTLDMVSLSPARVVDGVLVDGCRVQLECRLDRVIDDLDDSALIIGRVVAAHASQRALREVPDTAHDALANAPLLVYVHPGRVAAVHETKPFPYHRGFHE